jgi:hypothetical protein
VAWTNPKTWSVGETLTAANFNAHIRDNLLSVGPHLIARKTSDQTVSTTTLTAVTTIVAPVLANEVWWLEWWLIYSATSAEDMAFRFTFPTAGRVDMNTSGLWWNEASSPQIGPHSSGTSPTGITNYAGSGANRMSLKFAGLYTGGANAGNVGFDYAGATAGSPSVVMYTNSTLWGVKLA